MRRPALLFLAATLACSHNLAPEAGARWIELTSDHFRLTTDLSLVEASAAIRRAERERQAMLDALWSSVSGTDRRLRVVLLRDGREMQEFTAPWIGGFYAQDTPQLDGFVVASAETFGNGLPVLRHEVGHELMARACPGAPLWLREGYSTWTETLFLVPPEKKATFGSWHGGAWREVARTHVRDLASVFEVRTETAMDGEVLGLFESRSWYVFFYLEHRRRDDLNAYMDRLSHGAPEAVAFRDGFHQSPKELAAEIEAVRFVDSLRWSIPSLPWKGEVRDRALRPAEVHELFALLHAHAHGLPRGAHAAQELREAQAALALDPFAPVATVLAVSAADPRPDRKTGLDRLRAAVRAHPDDPVAHRLLGVFLALPEERAERRAELSRAVALDPDAGPMLLNNTAWNELLQGDLSAALDHARRACAASPLNPAALDTYAAVLARSGRCDEALKVQRRAVELLGDRATPQQADYRKRLAAFERGCTSVPLD